MENDKEFAMFFGYLRPGRVARLATSLAVFVLTVGVTPTALAAKPSGQTKAADLAIAVSDTPDPAMLIDEITYSVVISNSGPADVEVSVGAQLDGAGFTTVSSSQGTCSASGSFNCSLGTMRARTSASVTIRARPSRLDNVSLFAWVSTAASDPDLSNNGETEYTYIAAAPSHSGCGGPFLFGSDSCKFLATGGPISATAVFLTAQFSLVCSPNYCPLLGGGGQYETGVVMTDPAGRIVAQCSTGAYCATRSNEVITPGTPLTCTAYQTSGRMGAGAYACTG